MFKTALLTTVAIAALLGASAGTAVAKTYEVDKTHSSIGFSVRHMAISNVKGAFDDFEASFTYVPGQPDTWRCEAVIQAASIDTGNQKRDDHLRSDEFLDAAKYPTITFASTSVKLGKDGRGTVTGDLTLHGVTREVVLDLELLGILETSPFGDSRAGFTATGKINREDFGLTWNKVMEAGGLLVGDDVEIVIAVEGIAP